MFTIHRDIKFEDWLDRVDMLLDHSHNLSSDSFSDKFDFEAAYYSDLQPREVVRRLENKFL